MLVAFSLDKPSGLSSHQALYKIKKKFKLKKIGHTGTLDPFATGVLPIFVDEATKLIPYLDDSRKKYRAVLSLGSETDTLDSTGLVIKEAPAPSLALKQIEECLKWFVGYRKQTPPQYSSIKVQGKPLYRYAREGQEIKVEPRPIHIYDLQCISYLDSKITFECEVSRGTYVRVLGKEIAEALGALGHLTELRRIQSGMFSLDQSIGLDEILRLNSLTDLENTFELRKLIPAMEIFTITDDVDRELLSRGQAINIENALVGEETKVFVYFYEKLICVGEVAIDNSGKKVLKPIRGFNL